MHTHVSRRAWLAKHVDLTDSLTIWQRSSSWSKTLVGPKPLCSRALDQEAVPAAVTRTPLALTPRLCRRAAKHTLRGPLARPPLTLMHLPNCVTVPHAFDYNTGLLQTQTQSARNQARHSHLTSRPAGRRTSSPQHCKPSALERCHHAQAGMPSTLVQSPCPYYYAVHPGQAPRGAPR